MDFALAFDTSSLTADLRVEGDTNFQFVHSSGLRESVFLSLFLDRIAEPDDDTPSKRRPSDFGVRDDLRGWWADREYGSRLWLLRGAPLTDLAVERARIYAAEALAWIVDDGVAEAVDVEAEAGPPGSNRINLLVTITRGTELARFAFAWETI
jgi:phage gp46-like protein